MANKVPSNRLKDTMSIGGDRIEDEVTGVTFGMLDDDDDDDILIQAENITHIDETDENDGGFDINNMNFDDEMKDTEAANISLGLDTDPTVKEADYNTEESGFDFLAGKLWIYPTNYPVRDYQFNIVQKALYKNTLVVLPTGLGKTFIAAVVMYNFFRWFPQGKIVFMAPTKPLVAQQIQACYNIMGIPKADTVEMTGTMAPAVRQKAWREKRVVFLTPQVITNDLSRGFLTANSIKCLVLDEAHKALGNYAYCQVVREIVKFTRQFRILALSATPGSDLKAVQQVMNNLLISDIQLRSEESLDICPYTHERKVEKIIVPLGGELSDIKLKYIKLITCIVQRLNRNKVLFIRDASKVSTGSLLKARCAFRQNPPHNIQHAQLGTIEADFSTAISLCHGFSLLQNHGLRSLYNYFTGIITGEKGYGQTRSELLRNADFNDIVEFLRQKFLISSVDGVSSISSDHNVVVSHPKVQKLEEIVVAHFKAFQNNGEETRVMIFSEYRDSVQEITLVLNQHEPLIKAMPFIGQSSTGKSSKGYTQKDQLMVMSRFREGGYNTLVCTCVGEEGLDIGDVDLIVCFDAHKSPVRLVQRMGRTGRKRKGRIVMLVTEGKEEQIYNHSLYSMRAIHKGILNGAKSLQFYPNNPRMIPSSMTPQCHKMHITPAADSINNSKSKKTPSKSNNLMGNKSKKISVFSNQVKKVVENEYLTPEEYAEIKREFSVVSSTAKYLPRSTCITLSSLTENLHDKSKDNASQQIDFAEWMPWQNRLQSTHLIGHSIQSIHLVRASEFIEVQQCLEEGEDNYALEMSRILNVKDTANGNDHRGTQSSIFSFLTNVQDVSESEQINRLHSGNKMIKARNGISGCVQNKKKHKLRSITKKIIIDETSTEPVLIDSDSNLDDKVENKFSMKNENLKPNVSKIFTEVNDNHQNSGIQNTKKGANTDSYATHNLSSKQATNKKTKRLRNSQKVPPKGTKIKRKSVLELVESSSLKIPSEEDDDFEVDCQMKRRTGNWVNNLEKTDISNEVLQGNAHAIIDSMSLDVHMDSECKVLCSKKSLGNKAEKQIQEHNINICVDLVQSEDLGSVEAFHVPMPPPVSEVKELFHSLKSGKDFAELDLEELMEQWKRSECTGGGCNYKVSLLREKRSDLKFTSKNVDQNTSKSSLFKHITNKSMHENSFSEDPSFSKCAEKKHANNTETLHQLKFHTPAPNNKISSLTEFTSDTKQSKPFITGWDEIEMDINIPIKEVSPVKFHESFVTFSQALEYLQASSSEEYSKGYNISTPHVSPSKCETYLQGCGTKSPLCNTEDVDLRNRQKSECNLPSFTKSSVSRLKSCENDIDIPQSDLDNDDDVIPPTPVKNVSQESIFGFKTFAINKNLSDGVFTFSSSTICDKTLEASKKSGSDIQEKDQSASALGIDTGTNTFEPVVSAIDLKLSSDEDSDWKHIEKSTSYSFQHEDCISKSDANVQQNNEQSCKGSFNDSPVKSRFKELFENHKVDPSEDDKTTLHVDINCENETEHFHSIPKNQMLPFDKYNSNYEKELEFVVGSWTSTKGDRESLNDHSPETSRKSKARKLRLGKRQIHFPNSACQKNNSFVIGTKFCEYSELESYKRYPDEVSNNSEEADKYNKQMLDNNSENFSHNSEKLTSTSLGQSLSIQSMCRTNITSINQPYKKESLGFWENPDSVTVVKASTPVRDKPGNNQIMRDVLNDDENIPNLTPIKAHKNARETDSDNSFFVKRRKYAKTLDTSSDTDIKAESSNLSTNHIRLGKMLSSKQLDSCVGKGIEGCLDDVQHKSVSENYNDDIDDFVDNYRVAFKPKQCSLSKKIKVQRTKEAAEFIEKEADVSGDDMSSDEHEEMDDFYESSFIDNNTEMTQTQGVDMKAVYLKSVKSPVLNGLAGHYKIQYNTNREQDMNIFSQTLPEDHGMSEYEEDSFCVGNDEEDISYLDEESQFTKPKQQKLSKPETRQLKGRKNRIKVISYSSSEEDVASNIQLTQEFSTLPCKNGRKILFSSSEDEGSNENNTHLRNKQPFNSFNLDKSYKTFPKELCNKDAAKLEGLNMSQMTDDRQAPEQSKENVNTCVNTHQGLTDLKSVVADVGNFDIFEDWFDDFDLPTVDSCKSSVVKPLNQDKHKVKPFCTESKFLSLKNMTSECDKNTNENDLYPYQDTVNGAFSENNTNFKLQEGISSKNVPIPSSTHVDLSVQHYDNTEAPQEHSLSNKVHLSQFSTLLSPTVSDVSSALVTSTNSFSTTIDRVQSSQFTTNSSRPSFAMTRKERLQRQKEKQEMYRKKLKHVQQISGSTRQQADDLFGTSDVIPESDGMRVNSDLSLTVHDPLNRTDNTLGHAHSQASPIFTKLKESRKSELQLQILVDSREISGAQDIISTLRLKHCIAVTAKQLSSCDYILSNHLAVDRILWSNFSNSSYRNKLSSRICQMQALYERCVIIVEVDRVKTGQERSRKPIHRTKYLDTTLSYITQSKVKLYLTDNAEETANILADLCHVEKVKGRALNVPMQLSSYKEETFNFLLSMPGVTVPQALNLTHRFRSIVEILSSSASVIQERGCMTLDSAHNLYKFLHHKFDVHTLAATKS